MALALRRHGVKRSIFFGSAGSLGGEAHVGDVVIPRTLISMDGDFVISGPWSRNALVDETCVTKFSRSADGRVHLVPLHVSLPSSLLSPDPVR